MWFKKKAVEEPDIAISGKLTLEILYQNQVRHLCVVNLTTMSELNNIISNISWACHTSKIFSINGMADGSITYINTKDILFIKVMQDWKEKE